MKSVQKVIVFYGGISSEHEVSKMSFENVSGYFKDLKDFEFLPVLIDKNGNWYLDSEIDKIIEKEAFLKENINAIYFLNCLHGKGAEDGEIRKYLEGYGIKKITGSNTEVLKLTFDKIETQEMVCKIGVITPKSFLLKADQNELNAENQISKILGGFPYFVKPNADGSSVGLNIIKNIEELDKFLKIEREADFLIQEKVKGVEVTVGFDKNYENLPIMEVDNGGKVFDYESKYFSKTTKEILFAPSLNEKTQKELQEKTKKINEYLETSGATRTDWIVKENGECVFLEINTYPGLTKNSFIPKMLRANKANMNRFLDTILKSF